MRRARLVSLHYYILLSLSAHSFICMLLLSLQVVPGLDEGVSQLSIGERAKVLSGRYHMLWLLWWPLFLTLSLRSCLRSLTKVVQV